MVAFSRLSLARQFLVASFPILLIGLLVIGFWVGEKIERGVANRVGGVTGLYVDSFVAPHLQQLAHADSLDAASRRALDALLTETPLGKRIVAFKIWSRDGRILYSTDPDLIGRRFPVGEGLAAALASNVHSEISHLSEAENASESRRWSRLIETYSPVHADTLGTVLAAAEFYQLTDELDRETRAAQLQSWLVVAGTMLLMYLFIFGVVRRGSQTIDAQQHELSAKVVELSAVVAQNAQLHDRVRRAAARTTALNERFLRRISADMHDGPGQDLGLAVMRLKSLADVCRNCPSTPPGRPSPADEFGAVRTSLQSALADFRDILGGLQLPEIDFLTVPEVAARAVRDFEGKSNVKVKLTVRGEYADVSLPVRITLYRLLQESLANGFRHGGGADQRVDLSMANGLLNVDVSDSGPGFDPSRISRQGHVGLAGMRERVELLGGSFELKTTAGRGTTIRVNLPVWVPGTEND